MNRRLKLHEIFAEILGTQGQKKTRVYFQPPSNVQMDYPSIVYQRSRMDPRYANDKLYRSIQCYMVTVIDSDPESEIPSKILQLPFCRFDRHFTKEQLNHDVFSIFY